MSPGDKAEDRPAKSWRSRRDPVDLSGDQLPGPLTQSAVFRDEIATMP